MKLIYVTDTYNRKSRINLTDYDNNVYMLPIYDKSGNRITSDGRNVSICRDYIVKVHRTA
jgi:hypothetical protein